MNDVDSMISYPQLRTINARRRVEKSLALLHRRCSLERRHVFGAVPAAEFSSVVAQSTNNKAAA